ncbi:MAG: hypothetical protein KDD69_03905 [Bdellovibrionales bacterium]|nr:hypothetical protein [Bdellovibrionales bacterium]
MNYRLLKLLMAALAVLAGTAPAMAGADGDAGAGGGLAADSEPSPTVQRTDRVLPGERVQTPSGQTLKVWSTEGPVPVSPPARPFETETWPGRPGDVHIVVDEERLEKKRRREDRSGNDDSFDLREPRDPATTR